MERKLMAALAVMSALVCLLMCGCGNGTAEPETAEGSGGVFHSDLTSIDFLEGTWTNDRGQYITASRGNGVLIVWGTNIPLPACDLYVMRDGVLIGGYDGGQECEVLLFEYVDEDTITVHELLRGTESLFVRDTLEVDEENLDNTYVFWRMDRAFAYLRGIWMNDAGNYFAFVGADAGSADFSSDLPSAACDYIDFYEGVLCGFMNEAEDESSRVELFSFDIVGEDEMVITCLSDGEASSFTRLSRELDEVLLNSRYVFANNTRAFVFLNGRWADDTGNFFRVELSEDSLTWNTNLPLDDSYASYDFVRGSLVGSDEDENGKSREIEIYVFRVLSDNELEITIVENGEKYILVRDETEADE